jgi:hypothetical protein
MENNQLIPEDWERESLKDSVYLFEELQYIEAQIRKEEEESKRKEARIAILKKLPKSNEDKSEVLSF